MNTAELYSRLLRFLGPTRLDALLLELDEGNTYPLAESYGLSKVEVAHIRVKSTPLLTYHIKEGKNALESFHKDAA